MKRIRTLSFNLGLFITSLFTTLSASSQELWFTLDCGADSLDIGIGEMFIKIDGINMWSQESYNETIDGCWTAIKEVRPNILQLKSISICFDDEYVVLLYTDGSAVRRNYREIIRHE